jgi:hypothetical protein
MLEWLSTTDATLKVENLEGPEGRFTPLRTP